MFNILVIAAFLFALVLLLWLGGRSGSASDFLIGERKVSAFRIAASLASGFRDGAGIAAWVAFCFYFNIGAIWLFVGMALALLFLSRFSEKIRASIADTEIFSLNQYIEMFVGPKTATVSMIMLLITAGLVVAAQLHISGLVLADMLKLDPIYGIVLVSSVVATYLCWGGFRAVITTDVLQWLLLYVIFLIPLLLQFSGAKLALTADSLASPGMLIFSLVPLVFLIIVTSGDVWQRIFSALDPKAARNGLLLTIPFYFILSIGVILFGLAIFSVLPNADPGQALFEFFRSSGILPSWVLAIVGLFLVAAITSTIDTQTFVFASALTSGWLKSRSPSTSLGFDEVGFMRFAIIGFLCAASFGAYFIGDVVIFLFSSYSASTVLFPVLLFCIYSNPRAVGGSTDTWVAVVMIVSLALYLVLWSSGLFSNLAYTLIAPAFSTFAVLLLYGLGFLSGKTEQKLL